MQKLLTRPCGLTLVLLPFHHVHPVRSPVEPARPLLLAPGIPVDTYTQTPLNHGINVSCFALGDVPTTGRAPGQSRTSRRPAAPIAATITAWGYHDDYGHGR
jgi:hypothetical protein